MTFCLAAQDRVEARRTVWFRPRPKASPGPSVPPSGGKSSAVCWGHCWGKKDSCNFARLWGLSYRRRGPVAIALYASRYIAGSRGFKRKRNLQQGLVAPAAGSFLPGACPAGLQVDKITKLRAPDIFPGGFLRPSCAGLILKTSFFHKINSMPKEAIPSE